MGWETAALDFFEALRKEWSERQDLNLRRLGPKPSALARLSYAPVTKREYPTSSEFRNVFRSAFRGFSFSSPARMLLLWEHVN